MFKKNGPEAASAVAVAEQKLQQIDERRSSLHREISAMQGELDSPVDISADLDREIAKASSLQPGIVARERVLIALDAQRLEAIKELELAKHVATVERLTDVVATLPKKRARLDRAELEHADADQDYALAIQEADALERIAERYHGPGKITTRPQIVRGETYRSEWLGSTHAADDLRRLRHID